MPAQWSCVPPARWAAWPKVLIPVPSVAEQERVVAILDKFDALVSDRRSGCAQYGYHRDRLLTFDEVVA